MITFKHIPLKDFVKSYTNTAPSSEMIHSFGNELETFLSKALSQNDEEFQKNEINKFLAKVYDYDCNTKGSIDSAIYVDGEAQVLIETKALKNKTEFPKDTPLSKALYESILYFLRETQEKDNNSLKHIILANPYEFYIFDAKSFLIFANDRRIKKLYANCDHKEGTNQSTEKFYKDIQSYLTGEFEAELAYTYFSFSPTPSGENLANIYQLLSPQVLLKVRKTLDANTLNKGFYEELLYILGLQEMSESGKSTGKILIKPSTTANTLSYAIKEAYPTLDEEAIFTLITTWNNRILFLALLESMLLSFKHINQPFLDYSIIKDFKTLQTLFFEVLAKKVQERSSSLPKDFLCIPYLNSSLFDKIPLELSGREIGLLNSYALPLFGRSILKKSPHHKDKDSLPLLEYLFEFLHAYDFTTTPQDIKHGIRQNHDKLINSAVLGLVFEKLNGYKEGSFYTPSFITSYMCKESITQATLQKLNSTYGWEAQSLREVISYARADRISTSQILSTLLSLRLCDPAVGSGHFLVSALNEMILIIYTLGCLDLPLSVTLELENDEILIRNGNEVFSYTKPSSASEPSHKIQEQLFNLKKSIIENCLFGVDINPNSCEITKLRLWIELLKYSYYLFDEKGANTNALETLPNIDINIKCGNSLISYFDTHQNLTHYPNIKAKIQQYKALISDYKNGIYTNKSELDKQIQELYTAFKQFCFKDKYAKEIKSFQNKCDSYREKYGTFLAQDDENLRFFISYNPFPLYEIDSYQSPHAQEAKEDFETLQDEYNKLYNLESNNPFEWRFAFPEVLDSEGNFLGFDCVIGNPPYIKEENNKEIFAPTKILRTYQGKMDIWYHFAGKVLDLLKENGELAFIATNNWTTNAGAGKLRDILLKETRFIALLDFGSYMVFESASIQTMIMRFKKQKQILEQYNFDYRKITSNAPTFENLKALLNQELYEGNLYLQATINTQTIRLNN